MFLGETQGRELLGRNRSISLVRQPSEEVVILKRFQVRWLCSVTESGKQEAGASLRCREQQEHVSSRDVRTRASVQLKQKQGGKRSKSKKLSVTQDISNLPYLQSGSFLMTGLSKGLKQKNTVSFSFYIVNP